MSDRATIEDVAARSGVSTATVSRVLSGSVPARPETRERVLAAARELDYRPSGIARALKRRETRTIGLVAPGIGHSVLGSDPSGCADRQLRRFLAGRSVRSTCPRVSTNVPPLPILPSSFSQLRPAPGMRGLVGRTVTAVAVTVNDVAFTLSPAFLWSSGSGLRGGTYRAGRRSVSLRRLQVVPGVRLSGIVYGDGRMRLRVTGSQAADGSLRVTRTRIVGRLGGQRVSRRLGGASAAGRSRGRSAVFPHVSW